ncbi:SDR family NAD(P)-dependent oxidoreductase [Sphingomonas sp. SUN039]|uniref:SDR family NAD(P)-dependent oxidoreductase n=1 Tax=Sphingomonas sp. SUN039 TaxID=2937787 RepID=UPI0021645E21|nr:SDR family NAD(P)-dependent oxidoreductase [Sphingomonas sp. SUN039]UVO53432.1 SDR family NAD(P)-dependent oxidoreductase [Sphingomonas sp. SUN039]
MSEGKLALVTGASRGIGAATAEALAANGYHVVLTARTAAGLEEVENRIHDAGGSATIAPMDLTDGDSIGRLATAIAGRWGALDALVLNAAMLGTLTPVPHIDPKEFSRVMTLNVTAQATMIAAFDSMLRASKDARVIGVTSSVGATPRAYWGAYGASKAAFDTLLGSYADETSGRVKVAILDPGATRTAMRARAYPGEDPATLKGPEVVAARLVGLLRDGFESGERIVVNQTG